MLATVTRMIKWSFNPVLLEASIFWRYAGIYGPVVALIVCFGALFLVQRAVWLKEFCWAAAFPAIGVVSSPATLLAQIVLLTFLTCATMAAAWLAIFQTEPAVAL